MEIYPVNVEAEAPYMLGPYVIEQNNKTTNIKQVQQQQQHQVLDDKWLFGSSWQLVLAGLP